MADGDCIRYLHMEKNAVVSEFIRLGVSGWISLRATRNSGTVNFVVGSVLGVTAPTLWYGVLGLEGGAADLFGFALKLDAVVAPALLSLVICLRLAAPVEGGFFFHVGLAGAFPGRLRVGIALGALADWILIVLAATLVGGFTLLGRVAQDPRRGQLGSMTATFEGLCVLAIYSVYCLVLGSGISVLCKSRAAGVGALGLTFFGPFLLAVMWQGETQFRAIGILSPFGILFSLAPREYMGSYWTPHEVQLAIASVIWLSAGAALAWHRRNSIR